MKKAAQLARLFVAPRMRALFPAGIFFL